MGKLNDRQKRFADEWLIDMNGTQAAIRAGYSEKTANEQAARLLANVSIQEYLEGKREKLAEKVEITQERILQELAFMAFSDPRAYFHPDGTMKGIHELDNGSAAALASLEIEEVFSSGKDKKKSGEIKKFKRWDKRAAIETLNKMLGFNAPEKHQHDVGPTFLDLLMQTSSPNTYVDDHSIPKETGRKPKKKPGHPRKK